MEHVEQSAQVPLSTIVDIHSRLAKMELEISHAYVEKRAAQNASQCLLEMLAQQSVPPRDTAFIPLPKSNHPPIRSSNEELVQLLREQVESNVSLRGEVMKLYEEMRAHQQAAAQTRDQHHHKSEEDLKQHIGNNGWGDNQPLHEEKEHAGRFDSPVAYEKKNRCDLCGYGTHNCYCWSARPPLPETKNRSWWSKPPPLSRKENLSWWSYREPFHETKQTGDGHQSARTVDLLGDEPKPLSHGNPYEDSSRFSHHNDFQYVRKSLDNEIRGRIPAKGPNFVYRFPDKTTLSEPTTNSANPAKAPAATKNAAMTPQTADWSHPIPVARDNGKWPYLPGPLDTRHGESPKEHNMSHAPTFGDVAHGNGYDTHSNVTKGMSEKYPAVPDFRSAVIPPGPKVKLEEYSTKQQNDRDGQRESHGQHGNPATTSLPCNEASSPLPLPAPAPRQPQPRASCPPGRLPPIIPRRRVCYDDLDDPNYVPKRASLSIYDDDFYDEKLPEPPAGSGSFKSSGVSVQKQAQMLSPVFPAAAKDSDISGGGIAQTSSNISCKDAVGKAENSAVVDKKLGVQGKDNNESLGNAASANLSSSRDLGCLSASSTDHSEPEDGEIKE